MRASHLIIFLLFTILDIKVHAEGLRSLPYEKKPVQLPKSCVLSRSDICSVQTKHNKKFRWESSNYSLVLSGETIIRRINTGRFEFVKGALYVSAFEPIEIETEYGIIKTNIGRFLVSRSQERVEVQSIDAHLKIFLKGEEEPQELNPTFQMYFSAVTDKGRSDRGVLRAVDLRRLLERWSLVYPSQRNEFKEDIKKFYSVWKINVERMSETYKERIEHNRYMASERARKKSLRLKKMKEENEKILDLFKKKNHL